MAMNPKDLLLENGQRQPVRDDRQRRGVDWKGPRRTFQHDRLSAALGLLAVPPKGSKS